MRPTSMPCPACNSALRGSPLAGYRCTRCHAYYSTRHIRAMRRAHFGALIEQHFSHAALPQKPVARNRAEEVRSDLIVQDDSHEVMRAIAEAREAASDASKHLDDVVGGVEKIAEDREALVDAVKALPQLRHERRSVYQSSIGSSSLRKKIAKKTTMPISVKKKTVSAKKKLKRAVKNRALKKVVVRKTSPKRVTRRRR